MSRKSAAVWRLEALQTAINERIGRLESRKRLPRGSSVSDVRIELGFLEGEALRVGRELHQQLAAERDMAELRGAMTRAGEGVELGERVPATDAAGLTAGYADRV